MDGAEICKFCLLEFGNKSVLKVHYSIVHQGEEQINKSIQGISSEKNMNFETTMKKTKKCEFCNKSFATNRTLNSHIASFHEGRSSDGSEITLSCPLCSKSYASKKFLNRHIATVHEGKPQEKEFKCTLCDSAAFTQKQT